ncbi:MAG: LPP20 family lipoprotein [Bacteroides sp.]
MKKILFLCFAALLCSCTTLWAQEPAWVKSHPVSADEYMGVGMAPLSDPDYVKTATQNALSDLATQIALKVENNSFLQTVDVDGHSRQLFEDKIQTSLAAWLEGQQLKDSYRSNRNYYVLYTLSKKTYQANVEERRRQVASTGYHFLLEGAQAESTMDLQRAVELYAKGLQQVEPWTFLNLEVVEDGMRINVANELYTSLSKVFSGLALTTNVAQVEGEPFKAVATPIAGCLSRGGVVVPGVKLVARFAKGSGELTPAIVTDHNGTSEFYITNITSKEAVQEVRISIDDSFLAGLPKTYVQMLQQQSWPSAKVTVTLKAQPVQAYLYVKDDHDLEGIERNLRSLLTNNYFSLTEDPDAALCFIELSSSVEMGTVVPGTTTDLNSCLCSLELKFYNNKNEQLLLNYSVNSVKVLTPVNKSAAQSMAMCVREVMKRVNRELPAQLKKLNF